MGLSRGDDVIVGLGLLQHRPRRLHVLLGVPPVDPGAQVPQHQPLLFAQSDPGHRIGYLAGDVVRGPPRRFMIVEDPRRGMHAVCLAKIPGKVIGRHFADGIGALRVERRGFVLHGFVAAAEHVGRAGLEEADRGIDLADDLQDFADGGPGYVGRIADHVEAPADMVLVGLVVDLVGAYGLDDPVQGRGIGHVAPFDEKALVERVRIVQQMLNVFGVARRRAPHHAVHGVAFVQKDVGQVTAVLSGNAKYQSFFHGIRNPCHQTGLPGCGNRRGRACRSLVNVLCDDSV